MASKKEKEQEIHDAWAKKNKIPACDTTDYLSWQDSDGVDITKWWRILAWDGSYDYRIAPDGVFGIVIHPPSGDKITYTIGFVSCMASFKLETEFATFKEAVCGAIDYMNNEMKKIERQLN